MTGDDFTKARFAWLDAVKADRALTAPAFKAAFEIATQWTNREKFDATGLLFAWPALETIAAGIAMGERSTRAAVKQLLDEKWLQVDGHVGGRQPRYRLAAKRQDAAALNRQSAAASKRQGSAASENVKPAESRRAPRQSPAALKRQSSADKPFDKPSEEPFERDSVKNAFAAWWAIYPRKVAKRDAEKTYREVVAKGQATPEALIAGATRYANQCRNHDQKYTAHPATWLRGGRWDDEAAAPTRAGNGKTVPEEPPEALWDRKLHAWFNHGQWPGQWANQPDERGCDIPPDYVEAFRIKHGYKAIK